MSSDYTPEQLQALYKIYTLQQARTRMTAEERSIEERDRINAAYEAYVLSQQQAADNRRTALTGKLTGTINRAQL